MTLKARLLGIDIGTTGVRAAIFEPDGTLVADATVACTYTAPRPGWAEADPDAWWRAVVEAIRALPSASLERVACVCAMGQAPTPVLVDAAGAVVRSAILWLDTRAALEAAELGVQSYYLGPKLLWLARHDAPAMARAQHVLQSHAFIAMRLGALPATDPSTAALCIPLFDLGAGQWVHNAYDGLLPPIRRSTEIIGAVSAEAAAMTGLAAGTPIAAGGGDFAGATLGAGVLEEGEACLMLGTAGNLLVPRRAPGRDARLINAHHVAGDAFLSLGGTLSGGAQAWLRGALGTPDFADLDAAASRVATGSEGLLFLPYLQGERTPIWDATARGSFVGLGLHHGRGHLWRALLEGIALSFVDCQRVVAEDGVNFREVVAVDGGGKSSLFRQILCDALGVPLLYTPGAGGTVAGAALAAGLASGVLPDAGVARSWRGASVRHEPDPVAHARFGELLALRRAAYQGLKPVFSGLAAMR